MPAESKSLDSPDETRPIEDGTVEIVKLSSGSVMRTVFQPGWKWSKSVKPVAGTDSCQTHRTRAPHACARPLASARKHTRLPAMRARAAVLFYGVLFILRAQRGHPPRTE